MPPPPSRQARRTPTGDHSGRDRHVVLVGMMGSGKTTTGRAVADRLGRRLRDSDDDLEAREGRTGEEIAASDGVEALHRLEEQVLLEALAADEPAVIAAAGSVIDSARSRAAAGDHALVAWLDAPVDVLLQRSSTGDHRRPLERGGVEELLGRRRGWYEQLADLHLDARQPPDQLADRIAAALEV